MSGCKVYKYVPTPPGTPQLYTYKGWIEGADGDIVVDLDTTPARTVLVAADAMLIRYKQAPLPPGNYTLKIEGLDPRWDESLEFTLTIPEGPPRPQ